MKPTRRNPFLLAALSLAGLTLTATSAKAASGTWDGGGNNFIWGGLANWNPDNAIADGAGFTAFFTYELTGSQSITVNTARTIGNITFTDTTPSHDLTLATHASDWILTLNNSGSSPVINVTQSGRTLTINPRVAGTAGLTKSGAGNLVLNNAASTYSGNVIVSGGTLVANIAGTGGNSALGVSNASRTITANTGTILRFNVGNIFNNNFASNAVPSLVIAGTLTNSGTATNSALGNVTLNAGTLNAASGTGHTGGYGVWNLNGTVTSTGNSTISSASSFPVTLSAAAGTTTTFAVNSGTLSVTAPLGQITAAGDERISGLTKSGAGTMTLTAANSYTGATLVSDGALSLSGTGSFNTSSGLTVNGASAKFLTTSSVAVSPAVTLTQGTLTGSGTVNTVNVGDNTGGIISNNNGVAGAPLSIGALTFNGAAVVNTFSSGTAAAIVTTTLSTNAAGSVTLNPTASSWAIGTPHDLISYTGGSIGGDGFSKFVLGTVIGATPRQTKTLGNSGTAITLTVGPDDPVYWSGEGSGNWNLDPGTNWKLSSNNSSTNFLASDSVIFNDSATGAGPLNVAIDPSSVSPTSTTFNNSSKDYVLSGTAGITSGSLTKNGTGSVTLGTANTYAGGTFLNAGTLVLGSASALGTGPLTITGGTLDTSVATNSGNNVQAWNGDFTFAGTQSLSLGTGAVTLGADRSVTVNANTLTVGGAIGGGAFGLTKLGAGTLTLSAASTYTGNTTIGAGVLSMGANRIQSSPTIFIGDGATLQCTAGLTLAANQSITGTGATGFVSPLLGTGLITTSGSTISFSGTLTITRFDVRGLGNVISSGNIQSGGAGTGQRGLLVGNASTATLTINTGATLTTNGTATASVDVLGNNATTGEGTLIINGGSYLATGGLGQLNLGNGATNSTSSGGSGIFTLTSGIATIKTLNFNSAVAGTGTKTSAIVNLDGGTLTLNNIVVTSGVTKEFNFNGGQFVAGANLPAFSGLTMNVKNGGANIDTNGFSFGLSDALLNFGGTSTGGLTKSGLGSLTLSGNNTYAGGTSVTGGSLKFATAVPSTTNVSVSGGAEAGALVAVNDGQWVNTGNLSLVTGGGVVVDYGSTVPSTTVAPVSVSNFSIGATASARLTANPASSLAVGQTYPLVTWTGSGPTDGSAFTSATHRLTGSFSVAANTLSFTVTNNAAGSPISWNAGSGAWNTATSNWVDANLTGTTYFDTLDSVLFGDATGATGNPTVTLAGAVSPLSVTINSTRNYTVSGAGSIGGGGPLLLAAPNTGTFTLATANNSFSGGTTVNGGTLALAHATNTLPDTGAVTVDGATAVLSLGSNSDTIGALSLKNGGSITGSGTLTASSYALEDGSVAAILDGAGALTKSTAGTVTLSAPTPSPEPPPSSGGTLIISGDNSTRTAATNISGGTVVAAHVNALNTTGSVGISTATATGTLRLATDSSVAAFPLGSSSSFPGTIISDRATAGTGITHVLGAAIFGNNIWTIEAGANVTSGTAGVSIASVNLSAGGAGTSTFNPTTASLLIPGAVNIGNNNAAKTLGLSGTSTGNEVSGIISNGINTLSVSKTGTSTWTLSGANTYTGATTIDQGTLAFATSDQSLTGGLTFGATVNGTNTGTLDLSGVPSSATFAGALLVQTNSVTANTITLPATKTLTLNGGLTMSNTVNNAETRLTMTGGGALVVNGATITVGSNSGGTNISGEGHLNMAALGSFTATLSGNLTVQAAGDNSGANPNPASMTLSNGANSITAAAVRVGNSATGSPSNLWLGSGTNLIQTDLINLGAGNRDSGIIDFAGTGGSVTLRNVAGTGRVPSVNLGPQTAQATGYTTASLVDLTGNTADVAIGTFATSLGAKTAANTNDLRFDTGTLDIRSVNMAFAKGTGASVNKITIGGGTVRLGGSAEFSDAGTGVVTLATAGSGELIVNGGTVTSTASMQKGAEATGTATLTLNGGTLDLVGNNLTDLTTITYTDGTLSNVGTVNTGMTLAGTGSRVFNQTGVVSGTIQGAINGTGIGLTKQGTGTLTLTGANTYTGNTTVSAGTLSVNSAAFANAATVSVANGAVLNLNFAGTDTVGSLVLNGVTQAPGVYNSFNSGGLITGNGSITTGPSIGSFTNTNFSIEDQGNSAISGPTADPDGDGVINVIEYAFASNPNTPSRANLPVAGTSVVGPNTFVGCVYTRVKGASDLTFTVQFSNIPDDSGFANATEGVDYTSTLTSSTATTETFSIRDNTPVTTGQKRFVRILVTYL